MTKTKYRRCPDIMFTVVEEDVLALNVKAGQCYGMEDVTASVWNLLEEPVGIDELCGKLMETFDVEPEICREEVSRLIRQFQTEGLAEEVHST